MDKKSVIQFLAIFNGCHMPWLLHASTHTNFEYLLETCKRVNSQNSSMHDGEPPENHPFQEILATDSFCEKESQCYLWIWLQVGCLCPSG